MNPVLPIITKRLILQEFTISDVSKVFRMSNEQGIRTWIPDQVYRDEAHAAKVLRHLIDRYHDSVSPNKAPFVLGIFLKSNHELIGHVGLSPYRGDVEIGYAIEDVQQGNGYATEAVIAMTGWGLGKWNLPYIIGIAEAENIASCKVLEKAGYELHQTIKKNMCDGAAFERIYKKSG